MGLSLKMAQVRLSELEFDEVSKALRKKGITVDTGLASFHIRTPNRSVARSFYDMYSNHMVCLQDTWFDFTISVESPPNLRRLFRPQALFKLDGIPPFLPLPKAHSYPLLEWGMNWCVASHYHTYLILHAAVLEKSGKAVILPAPPGSGKSTLCTYLAYSGWRLLSDEMAVIDLVTGEISPFLRPICVKNDAIDIVKRWFPDAVLTPTAKDTQKGSVAHIRPPINAIQNTNVRPRVHTILFPSYSRDAERTDIRELNHAEALPKLLENAFNNEVLGADGFRSLIKLMDDASLIADAEYANVQDVDLFLTDRLQEATCETMS
ncbi:HprK-related kinase A [Alteromonas antoniana]|uniref:HprK-related kinase A n=1 Tax=Alteromonas antoniana TaxID=2803813 RepID=UPI001C480E63|nr:HprK-related kinase A [Alteromonas antoniana]